ncbi:MAG: sulfatase-like hydrolase/transferase [Bacteroidaceae bacterium]
MNILYSTLGLAFCSLSIQAQGRPNILIIQCDHLTQRVVGAYGNSYGLTPTIDKYAAEGVVFANAYVGCPLSQPSRASLWTGMMPHQTNVRSNSPAPINPEIGTDVATLGELFSADGYDAVHFGKCHDMGALRGFKHKEPTAEPFKDADFFVNNDSFLDVGTCKDVVSYLKHPSQKPFICIADFQNPHNICGFVGDNKGVHIDKPITEPLPELPINFEVKNWEGLHLPVQYICCTHRRMSQAAEWNEINYRHYIAAFHHYTKMVMTQIDQVIEALNSTPAGKNTIVIFMADHGDGMSSHRMVTKQISFYDEVTNVPFIFSGPGIKKQTKLIDNLLVSPTLDLLPTLCDIAGIAVPASKPGISLLPTLKGKQQAKFHPYVVSEWHSEYETTITPGRMIRSPRYKYIHYLEGDGEELYDLKNDPQETNNLAHSLKSKKIIKKHRALLNDYLVSTNDDYRSLKVKVDKQWREHTPGYPNHHGACARDGEKKK